MGAENMTPLVEAANLKLHFRLTSGATLKAVDGVSFAIPAGKTLGLVGESGCGKTTTGRALVGLYPPTGGKVFFRGSDTRSLDKHQQGEFTRHAQMIFQDP